MLVYQGRVVFDASTADKEVPPLVSPEAVSRPPGHFARGGSKVARLRREVRRPKAALKSGDVGVTSPPVAYRPDSMRGRRELKKALHRVCDDGTAYGVFVAMWFADESNWLPESTPGREDAVAPPRLIEDTASLRKRIEAQWRSISPPERALVEAEWLRRILQNFHGGAAEMVARIEGCAAGETVKRTALQRLARQRLKAALEMAEEEEEVQRWTRMVNHTHAAGSKKHGKLVYLWGKARAMPRRSGLLGRPSRRRPPPRGEGPLPPCP